MASEAPSSNRRQRIGKFDILQHIATGGMGAVYKALDTEGQRVVALKVLAPEMAGKPNMLERFRREARSASKLNHENIVAIHECGEFGGAHYLSLEFVEGVDLGEYIIRKKKIAPEEARQILIQATRALDHAFLQNIVHRDIKPSNFLLTKKNGQLVVKLTDMGLARDTNTEEFRVTKDGTTVGTVDYISPEQARNSADADTRSDIYSLGCTFYHMLSGSAPFAQGSLPERILQHIEAEPVDVRQYNPAVPDSFVAILQKMLAKSPLDRYQTPSDLLADLEDPERALAQDSDPEAPSVDASADETKKIVPTEEKAPRKKKRKDSKSKKAAPSGMPKWAIYSAGGVLGLVLVASAIVFFSRRTDLPVEPPSKGPGPGPIVVVPPDDPKKPEDPPPVKPPVAKDPGPVGPFEDEIPKLARKPFEPIAWAKEFIGPFQTPPKLPEKSVTVRVARTGKADARSIADALVLAKPDQVTIIELHDQGPHYETDLPKLENRHVAIRAGIGFRPIVAWDLQPAAAGQQTFLSVEAGSLSLEQIDFVVKWPDSVVAAQPNWILNRGGFVRASLCSFSQAGKITGGMNVAQLARLPDDGPRPPISRLLMKRCLARGADQALVAVKDAQAEVLLDGCLVVGNDTSLVKVQSKDADQTTLRFVNSTLVSGQGFLSIEGAGKTKVLLSDDLIAHSDPSSDLADLVRLGDQANLSNLTWRAANAIYAGFKQLAGGSGVGIPSSSLDDWHKAMNYVEGDLALEDTWPSRHVRNPEEVSPNQFYPYRTPVYFAALSHVGPLGSSIGRLPTDQPSWVARVFDPPTPSAGAWPTAGVPEIPVGSVDQFHGERLDLTKTDLGAYLASKAGKFGPRVVMHLSGSGKVPTTPVTLRSLQELVLYFEPPRPKETPLTLVPNVLDDHAALIEIDGGNLEIIQGRIEFANKTSLPTPRYMLKVKGGNLALSRCELKGPLGLAPGVYLGLLSVGGPGETMATSLTIQDSVLWSGKRFAEVQGPGVTLRCRNSLLLSVGDGFDLVSPGDIRCFLEKNTFAFRNTLIQTRRTGKKANEPIRIWAEANLFLDPFVEAPRQAQVINMPEGLISQGQFAWQGKGNAYDGRLKAVCSDGPIQLAAKEWSKIWGSAFEQGANTVTYGAEGAFRIDAPTLANLYGISASAGADLAGLGIPRKK